MKSFPLGLLALTLVGHVFAAEPAGKTKAEEKKSPWVFSLLPKSVQKDPNLDLTVITEMSAAGKALPPASPKNPVYYLAQSGGFKAMGEVSDKENKLTQPQVEAVLQRALAASGYLPAKDPEHPATIVITYIWGSHNMFNESDADAQSQSPEKIMRNVLDRAALVGGEKFARELLQLFVEADAQAAANSTVAAVSAVSALADTEAEPSLLSSPMTPPNPVQLFKLRSAKNEFLVDQAMADCFYLVASAYDYKSIVEKKKILLWRTRMTANSQGVSQEQSLPTLIASAGPFFGKEMSAPETLVKRSTPTGSVSIGEAVVIDSSPAAPPPPAKK